MLRICARKQRRRLMILRERVREGEAFEAVRLEKYMGSRESE